MKSTLFTLLTVVTLSYAQTPFIGPQNTLGGNNTDSLSFVVRNYFGLGYVVGGSSFSNISGDKSENSNGGSDFWCTYLDWIGNLQWQNTIGGTGEDILTCIEPTSDGGYILGGYSNSDFSGDKNENSMGGFDYWVVKIDNMGNIQWQNTIGGGGDDILKSLTITSDGGYMLAGTSYSEASGDKTSFTWWPSITGDYWVVKINSMGMIEWNRTFGGDALDDVVEIKNNGNYILGGYSYSNMSGNKVENNAGLVDCWLVCIDNWGNIQWQNTIGGNGNDYLTTLSIAHDGNYIWGGYSNSDMSGDKTENSLGGYDYWIMKLDAFGNVMWQNTIGGSGDDKLYDITNPFFNEINLVGSSNSNISGDKTENSKGGYDYWVVKMDNPTHIEWQKTIGGNGDDIGNSLIRENSFFFTIGGYSHSNISGDKNENSIGAHDFWLIQLVISPLPVELVSFTAEANENENTITWITASETNNDYFVIEKSENGIHYYPIDTVKGAGNSNSQISYSINDPQPLSAQYYKLSQTDFDGTQKNYDPIYLENKNLRDDSFLSIYPNPSSDYIYLSSNITAIENVKLIDQKGNVVKTYSFIPSSIDMYDIASGVYIVEITQYNQQKMTKKIIKH